MQRILSDARLCSGCRVCELICSFVHEGEFNPSKARMFVEINRWIDGETPTYKIDVPHLCAQCYPAPCAKICPGEAIVQDSGTGAHCVDHDVCNGCGLCVDACPYGSIFLDESKQVAIKCDLCGGDPQCVAFCPRGALAFVEINSES